MNNRITPEPFYPVFVNDIFVFGSNLAGRHGKGAAKRAIELGAKYGQGIGLSGQTYAIPTKSNDLQVLPLDTIRAYVAEFIAFTRIHPEYSFYITAIGCGLAGYSPLDMAPLFWEAAELTNVNLPAQFLEVLT